MKATITLTALLAATSLANAVSDEGTVTWVDGKGAFQLTIPDKGTIVLNSNAELMANELQFKNRRWPHLYKDIKPGDFVSVEYCRDPMTGKYIARFIGIKKRGG